MMKKQWKLIVLVLVLGGISFYLNRDWFSRAPIPIKYRFLPRATAPLFGFEQSLQLTEVKVIAVSDIATNKYPHALWHLVSKSRSVPVNEFLYGAPIQGMQPVFDGAAPEPLAPGTSYRLLVKAGSVEAAHDFETPGRVR